MDRRYNKYWRLPGSSPAAAAGGPPAPQGPTLLGDAAEQAAEQAEAEAACSGDRLVVEMEDGGALSIVASTSALAALVAGLERKGARESQLYASLIRYREALEADMPAAPLALPAAEGPAEEEAEAARQQRRRQQLLSLSLAAPPLQPQKIDGRSKKLVKEAAAADAAAEAAAAADLTPLREGDELAVTRVKLDLLRCQRGVPAAALAKDSLNPATWQAAVREAGTLLQLRSLLGEVSWGCCEVFRGFSGRRRSAAASRACRAAGQAIRPGCPPLQGVDGAQVACLLLALSAFDADSHSLALAHLLAPLPYCPRCVPCAAGGGNRARAAPPAVCAAACPRSRRLAAHR
jgi:hypothetical protein